MRMSVPSVTSVGSQMWVRGPTAEQTTSAPTTPSRHAANMALLRHPASAGRTSTQHQVAWVSTHGGAGASTLARVLGGADIGRRWPDPARGEPGRVLLVARTHTAGLQAASQALNALRKGEHPAGVQLVAVVLVADAPGRLPRPLGRRVRVMRSAAEVHRVPWVPAWRLGEGADHLPRPVRALARLISPPLQGGGESR